MADEEYTGPSPLTLLRSEELTGKKPGNLVGISSDDVQKYLDLQRQFVRSLEDRYQQPNLFKVAAGFAKPQLGGFLASLGSAAGALGEQQEKQRDIQLPLYKARAELSAYEMGLKQKGKAATNIEKAAEQGRVLKPSEAMETVALEEGPTAGAKAGESLQSSQSAQMLSAISSARDWATLIKDLGSKFSEEQVGSFLAAHPEIVPPIGTPSQYKASPVFREGKMESVESGGASPASIPGVPSALSGDLTRGQELASTNEQIQRRIARADELNKTLGQQASASVPIYESAASLYQLASKPTLKPVFAIFEGGDPMSILGKAMEDQSLSSVLSKARDQIIHARYGSKSEKDQALSDFHAFENALSGLNMSVIAAASAGIQNPTDLVRRAEVSSVPGIKNTRDAFLRGVARLGSDALSRYEIKNALNDYLKSKDADINNWEGSEFYKSVMQNAKNRQSELLSNQASTELPAFMRKGLEGGYRHKQQSQSDLRGLVKRRLAELDAKKTP